MSTCLPTLPKHVEKKKSRRNSLQNRLETSPNEWTSSDLILDCEKCDSSETFQYWTSSTGARVLDEEDIGAWLQQQDRKSAETSIVWAVNEFDLVSASSPSQSQSSQTGSPGAMNEVLHGNVAKMEETDHKSDMPMILRGVGAFTEDVEPATSEKEKKRTRVWTKTKHRPLIGWDNLWL
ncbi:uncharacterized protein CTRU02_208727 [Colletotrichum truncatum]|uniref:Uncharacterized protein n=1 Tax=Colletotrichum truncatum TaxID=5467 RepID=A0ACC3YZM0_COLTU|nr:uncharacterized protein CTRU02_06616 [Colletotrichum truncatum]KAF6792533.1 hypothetical protein CTRU02_06616 [Colletotrichum truncatum]